MTDLPTGATSRPAVHVFTTVARNYTSQAAVLHRSIRQHCGDALSFTCFVTDGYDDIAEIPPSLRGCVFDCRRLGVLDFEERSRRYSVTEFATSLKADIFLHLFRQGCDYVIFLDPDIELFMDLSWVAEAMAGRSILLTPHVLSTAPYLPGYKGPQPDKKLALFLRVGFFNTGFLAIKNDAVGNEFLALLREVLKDQALNAYCYDQSWIGMLAGFFPANVAVTTDPGINVAYWNAHERVLTQTAGGGYLVNGSPLKFVHYSKIEAFFPGSVADGPHHQLLAENPAYVPLFIAYRQQLEDFDFSRQRQFPYRFAKPATRRRRKRPLIRFAKRLRGRLKAILAR